MRITPDIIREEFVGTNGTIVSSPHSGYLDVKGMVRGETRNTFLIEQQGEMKRIVKDQAVFHFKFSDGTVVEINGKLLVGKPEDRIKKIMKRLW